MFSVVIPIFNEEQNISNLLFEIKNSLSGFKDYEIIYVNDSSKDKSLIILEEIVKKNNNIRILNNEKNKGQSYSIFQGVKEASFDIIVTIDGDGQNNPIDISNLVKLFLSDKKISLVGGIRTKRKDSLVKIFSSKIANYIRAKILNDECSDTGCSLKVFDKRVFLDFPYFNGMHRFLPALFKGYGYNTMFIEVDHRHRKHGNSKYGTFDRLYKGIFDMIRVKKILNNKNK
tara:strand:+ start:84 stop:773 length:690 start_codon:yes stop_codon:yes gene_type:complete